MNRPIVRQSEWEREREREAFSPTFLRLQFMSWSLVSISDYQTTQYRKMLITNSISVHVSTVEFVNSSFYRRNKCHFCLLHFLTLSGALVTVRNHLPTSHLSFGLKVGIVPFNENCGCFFKGVNEYKIVWTCLLEVWVHIHPIMIEIHPVFFFISFLKSAVFDKVFFHTTIETF